MPVSLVAAVARGAVIGRGGKLPWHLPADLLYFKRLTMGHSLIMGRVTWEAIGRPLRGRRSIVLTRKEEYRPAGCIVAHGVEEAIARAGTEPEELFVVGGARVFSLFLPLAERLYITHVDADFPGDAFFPTIEENEWRIVDNRPGRVDDANPFPHRFTIYERRHA